MKKFEVIKGGKSENHESKIRFSGLSLGMDFDEFELLFNIESADDELQAEVDRLVDGYLEEQRLDPDKGAPKVSLSLALMMKKLDEHVALCSGLNVGVDHPDIPLTQCGTILPLRLTKAEIAAMLGVLREILTDMERYALSGN